MNVRNGPSLVKLKVFKICRLAEIQDIPYLFIMGVKEPVEATNFIFGEVLRVNYFTTEILKL